MLGNTTGFNNSANGVSALLSNTTGFANTADGFTALQNNTTGNSNTAAGDGALGSNTITLSGKTAAGANVTMTTQTNAQGRYSFSVGAGTYSIAETQATGFLNGKTSTGFVGSEGEQRCSDAPEIHVLARPLAVVQQADAIVEIDRTQPADLEQQEQGRARPIDRRP